MDKSHIVSFLQNKYEGRISLVSEADNFREEDKLQLHCAMHGPFTSFMKNLRRSPYGCRKCRVFPRLSSSEEKTKYFLGKAKEVHGESFDYSKSVITTNLSGRVTIKCNTCNTEYETKPSVHLSGSKCKVCVGNAATTLSFSKKCIERHGGKYSYSKVEYINVHSPVIITCNVDGHGDFCVTPMDHLHNGKGCPICDREAVRVAHRKHKDFPEDPVEYFKAVSNKVHGDRYDYSLVEYFTSVTDKVPIICQSHGLFQQVVINHTTGSGCPSCCKSDAENEMYDWLVSIGETDIERNVKILEFL